MKKIPLTQGKFALVDDIDYRFISQWKWQYFKRQNGDAIYEYAVRSVRAMDMDTLHRCWMHRQITGTPLTLVVDHKDGNGLNNQKSNLRICTDAQNKMNRIRRIAKSGYLGVKSGKYTYEACVKKYVKGKGKKFIHLLNSPDPVLCAKVRDVAAKLLHGEMVSLNFPDRDIRSDMKIYGFVLTKIRDYL